MKLKSLLIFILTFVFNVTLTQENQRYKQTIRGTVVEKVTQNPLPGVKVVIQDSSPVIGATTDLNGEFKLENIPTGRLSLYISFVGFDPLFTE